MLIQVNDPTAQTLYFIAAFLIAVVLSLRNYKKHTYYFPIEKTIELKGFAILAILFAHIGYQLTSNTKQFLYPFSVFAGVGVDLFLLLSGFGLTVSYFNRPLSILDFYKKRLLPLFTPLWVTLILFLIMDFIALNKTYPFIDLVKNFLGFYPRADINLNINSPLWFITIISFYYLIYPFFIKTNNALTTSLLLIYFSYWVLNQDIKVHQDTLTLYKLHTLSFPSGVVLAGLLTSTYFKPILEKIEKIKSIWQLKVIIILILSYIVGYFAIFSGVGKGLYIEQKINIFITLLIFIIFYLKNIKVKMFTIFGIFSFEIYLLHWPLLYRYDLFYKFLPASLATILYLILFLILGNLIQKLLKTRS